MTTKHKACVHCEARVPLAVAVCPFCGGRQPDPRPAMAEARRGKPASTPPPGRPASDPPADTKTTQSFMGLGALDAEANARPASPRALRDARFAAGPAAKAQAARRGRWFWAAVLALAAGVGGAWWTFHPRPLPMAGLEPFGERALARETPCAAGRTCVVAYLTPWDPSSERSLNTLERLDTLLAGTNVQLVAVVGHDERAQLEAFAATVPTATWLDPSDYIRSARDLQTVPTWFVIDPLGRVRKAIEGTYFPLDYHLGKLGLRLEDPS
ncbi:MAG: hypothetical protein H6702_16180 [Myxococcales bacterium]|nr:hypothetical protein [Myxococcales bacterium]